jgi:hypothetical protein
MRHQWQRPSIAPIIGNQQRREISGSMKCGFGENSGNENRRKKSWLWLKMSKMASARKLKSNISYRWQR